MNNVFYSECLLNYIYFLVTQTFSSDWTQFSSFSVVASYHFLYNRLTGPSSGLKFLLMFSITAVLVLIFTRHVYPGSNGYTPRLNNGYTVRLNV